jgi:hypothetical protein
MKLPQPWYQVADSLLHPWVYAAPLLYPWRTLYVVRYLRWQRGVRSGPRVGLEVPGKLTVILLAWKRMRNMEPLVRSLLRCDFVERIIVSNNNPEYRIADWISLRDERLRLMDQPRKTAPGIRFELAREDPGSYFISIDDDTLLYPEQVEQLFLALLARPGAVHGLQGERYVGESGTGAPQRRGGRRAYFGWEVNVRRREEQVDVINTVYTFNRDHVTRLYERARELGVEVGGMANGEDILLSACGSERPWVHDVGPVTECISYCRYGVSTWRTRTSFFKERTELFQALHPEREERQASAVAG